MKKIVWLAILVPVVYLAWRFVVRGDALVLVAPAPGKRVSGAIKRIEPQKEIVVEIDSNADNNRITEISLSRQLASQLGIGPPSGFAEEPLPLTEKELKDKDAVAFAEKFNKETLRWAGNLVLAPNARTEILFPVRFTTLPSGYIDIVYRTKFAVGGGTALVRIDISPTPPTK